MEPQPPRVGFLINLATAARGLLFFSNSHATSQVPAPLPLRRPGLLVPPPACSGQLRLPPLTADLGPAQPGNRCCCARSPGQPRSGTLTGSTWRDRQCPAAAADHAVRARSRPLRVNGNPAGIVAIPVLAPLPHIPVHVIQSPRIRQLLPHRMRLSAAVVHNTTRSSSGSCSPGSSP